MIDSVQQAIREIALQLKKKERVRYSVIAPKWQAK